MTRMVTSSSRSTSRVASSSRISCMRALGAETINWLPFLSGQILTWLAPAPAVAGVGEGCAAGGGISGGAVGGIGPPDREERLELLGGGEEEGLGLEGRGDGG